MPKIVSELEKNKIRETIHHNTVKLIRRKGLKKITVEDITRASGIAKGSFYAYYESREECLYTVIRRSEQAVFERMECSIDKRLTLHEQITKILRELYLADDSLVLYIQPIDLENLIKKLPKEYQWHSEKKAINYFSRTLALLHLDPRHLSMEVLGQMMGALHLISASKGDSGGKQKAMDLIIAAIADYMAEAAEE
ncbi:MAG: TetR/AcrR family transcriptional regulator [Acetanaerobacterium sp.]